MNSNKTFHALAVKLSLCLLLAWSSAATAENVYDEATGSIMVPVISVGPDTAFSTIFSLADADLLLWGADEFNPIDGASSRTAAVYNSELGSLWIPEIMVSGELLSLNFFLVSPGDDCEFTVCITPELASAQGHGRAGSTIFTNVLSSASTYTCSTCHAISETDGFAADGFRRPGHSLLNASRRPSYKNGQYESFLEAVNTCVTDWMNATALEETDQEWINLLNWFEDQATVETAEVVTIDIVEPLEYEFRGNGANGRELFNTRCIVCHGLDGEGTPLAPKITEKGLTPEYIARRTRTSGRENSQTYDGLTGGIMPFWGANRLTDGELTDIIEFVTEGATELLTMGGDNPMNLGETGCTSDHPKVGQTAVFPPGFHRVAGTATIIDDCTIDLTGFYYDGGGIEVRVYLGVGGRFHPQDGGFSISDDLLGIAFENATLRLTLPPGRTLDDFDSISIWCVAVGQSFSTGYFR